MTVLLAGLGGNQPRAVLKEPRLQRDDVPSVELTLPPQSRKRLRIHVDRDGRVVVVARSYLRYISPV